MALLCCHTGSRCCPVSTSPARPTRHPRRPATMQAHGDDAGPRDAQAPHAGLTVMCATGSSVPFLLMTAGETLKPPVLRPMRSVRSMKLSVAVPIWVRQLRGGSRGGGSPGGAVGGTPGAKPQRQGAGSPCSVSSPLAAPSRVPQPAACLAPSSSCPQPARHPPTHRQKSGTRGSRSRGMGRMSKAMSRYSTSLVNRSWVRIVAPPGDDAGVDELWTVERCGGAACWQARVQAAGQGCWQVAKDREARRVSVQAVTHPRRWRWRWGWC